MRKILALSLLLIASALCAAETAHGPVTKVTSGASKNQIDEDIIVGNGRSVTPTGTGNITATTAPWAGLTGVPSPTITASGDASGTVTLSPSGGATLNLTLANSGVTAGTYGTATQVPVVVTDAKGRITGVSLVTIAPAFASIASKPTSAAGYGITNGAVLDSFAAAQSGTAQNVSTSASPTFGGLTVGGSQFASSGDLTVGRAAGSSWTWQSPATDGRIVGINANAPFLIIPAGTGGVSVGTSSATASTFTSGFANNSFTGNVTVNGGMVETSSASNAIFRMTNTAASRQWQWSSFSDGKAYLTQIGTGSINAIAVTPVTGDVAVAGNLLASGTGTHAFAGPVQVNSAASSNTTLTLFRGVLADFGARITAVHATGDVYFDSVGDNANPLIYVRLRGAGTPVTAAVFGTTGARLSGTNINDNAATGFQGEYLSSTVAQVSAVSLTTDVATQVTSITLGAGDWDVSGVIAFTAGGSTTVAYLGGGTSLNGSAIDDPNIAISNKGNSTLPSWERITIPTVRVSTGTSTPVYLMAQSGFSVSIMKAWGRISARRIR